MPKSNLAKLCKILNRSSRILLGFLDETLTGTRLSEFFSCVSPCIFKIDSSNEERWAAWDFCKLVLTGKVMTKTLFKSFICQLVSFIPEFKAGISPTLWKGNETEATMQCVGVRPAQEKNGKPRLKVKLLCLEGAPAGLFFEVELSRNLLEYILGKKLGLSFKKYNSCAEEISGCIFRCKIREDIAACYLTDYSANTFMKKYNRSLAEARLSLTKCKTPLLPCSSCRATRDKCLRAVWY